MDPKTKKYIRNSIILVSLVGIFWAVPFMNIMRFYPEYQGLVVDSETGRPVEKAQVIVIYEYEIGSPGGPGSSYLGSYATWTDAEGRFGVPARPYFRLLLLGWFREHPKVSIYKAGYRSMTSFLDDNAARVDPAQGPHSRDLQADRLLSGVDKVFRLLLLKTDEDWEKWGRYGQYIGFLDSIPPKVRRELEREGFVFKHPLP